MTIHLAGWTAPLAATLILWAFLIFKPMPPDKGPYDFGAAIFGLFRLGIGVSGTLLFWLAYFAALALWR